MVSVASLTVMDARDRHVVEKQLPMPLLWIFVANAFASPWRVAPQNRLAVFSSRTPLVIPSARYMDELAVFFRQFATRCVSDESLATILTFLSQH